MLLLLLLLLLLEINMLAAQRPLLLLLLETNMFAAQRIRTGGETSPGACGGAGAGGVTSPGSCGVPCASTTTVVRLSTGTIFRFATTGGVALLPAAWLRYRCDSQ